MSILKVARIAHPVLRSPAKPVPKEAFRDRLFQKLIDDMRETMYEYEGVGLAAPQVHEGLRLAVIEVPGSDERSRAEVPFFVLVNPVVTPLGDERENGWEGCLSIPDLRGVVPRLKRLKLDALDREVRRMGGSLLLARRGAAMLAFAGNAASGRWLSCRLSSSLSQWAFSNSRRSLT